MPPTLSKPRKPAQQPVESDDDDDKLRHPYVLVDELRLLISCPPRFASGDLQWSNKMTTGRTTDEVMRTKVGEFIRSHCAGDSLSVRQEKMREMWSLQFNQPACVFMAFFTCAGELAGVTPSTLSKKDAINYLVENNIPFVPWDILQDFIHRLTDEYVGKSVKALPPMDWEPEYVAFLAKFPYNGDNLATGNSGKKIGSSVRSENSKAATKLAVASWQLALDEAKLPGLSLEQQQMLLADGTVADDGQFKFNCSPRSDEELKLRDELVAKYKIALANAKSKDEAIKKQLLLDARRDGLGTKHTTFAFPPDANKRKRTREDDFDEDDDEARPLSGLLAHEKFMRAMRLTIDRSEYINFASMSKERLDQLHVLGVGSANSKRLSSSTVLLTSASEADVKIATYDFEAIASGFLYTYITLVSESSFTNAMDRVKDRLAWWQWLTGFFNDNKAAAVKFIHWFMLAHHSEEFWLPVTKTQCVLLAIKAKDECHLPISRVSPQIKTAPKTVTRDAKARPGPGTLTINGGVTFTPSQTAKIVQWRSRFAGFCVSRMTREYTCAKEKRGLPCKFKHECVWCHSATCKAACAQAEKL